MTCVSENWLRQLRLALPHSACPPARPASTPRCPAIQPAQIVPGQSFYVVPREGIPDNRNSTAMRRWSRSSLRPRAIQPAGAPQAGGHAGQGRLRRRRGQDQGVRRRARISILGYSYGARLALRVLRPFWAAYGGPMVAVGRLPILLRMGRSVHVWLALFEPADQLHRLQELSRHGHRPPRATTRRCSRAMPRRARGPTSSTRWCRTWSTAMFTGFPGRNGETVKITVPTGKTKAFGLGASRARFGKASRAGPLFVGLATFARAYMTDQSVMKPTKFQRRAEDRPREICAAAFEVFAEKGFAAAKLDEIAKRAGVSKGTLYLYFKDKEDLFRAVIRDTVAPNIDAVREGSAQANLPFAQVVRMFLARFADVGTRLPVGAVAKMVIGESRNFPELAKVWHDQVASQGAGHADRAHRESAAARRGSRRQSKAARLLAGRADADGRPLAGDAAAGRRRAGRPRGACQAACRDGAWRAADGRRR